MFNLAAIFSLGIFASFVLPVHQAHAQSADNATAASCTGPVKVGNPYKGVFYANNFNYLLDPCLTQNDPRDEFAEFTDQAKRLSLGGNVLLDLGGEFRIRFHSEDNHGLTRLNGLDNSFFQTSVRAYANLEIGKNIRFYAESIDARVTGGELPARGIEVDHLDLLNGFGEVRGKLGSGKGFLRAGRQEMIFGAQRFVSPLDWSNTRRTFDGFRAQYSDKDWVLDAFVVRPRNLKPRAFNDTNGSQAFIGGYATYKGLENQTFDVFLLHFEEDRGVPFNFSFRTLGSRGKGTFGNFTWEVEAAYQFGSHDQGGKQRAAMFTAGGSYNLAKLLPAKPSISLYYDWASGDGNSVDGKRKTFHQMFPLGHAYFGFMDLVGRQNISAWNLRLNLVPVKKVKLQITGHMFNLANARDALYNAGGGAIRRDPTGLSGKDVGEELDVTVSFPILQRVGALVGYSKFWAGNFVKATNGAGVSGNADFFYLQFRARF